MSQPLGPLQQQFVDELEEGSYTMTSIYSELAFSDTGYKNVMFMGVFWLNTNAAIKIRENPELFFTTPV